MTHSSRGAWQRVLAAERIDAVRAAVVAVTVVLTWWMLLGWRWDTAVAAGDLKEHLRWIELLGAAGGDWRGTLYDYRILGGVPLHDVFGTRPLAQMLALAGCNAVVAANLTMFFVQGALAYLGASAVFDLAASFGDHGGRRPTPRAEAWLVVALVWLVGFSPIVIARVAGYHGNLLFGLLVFVAGVALIARARDGRWSVTFLAGAGFALGCGLATYGYQVIFYALVFAGPLLGVLVLWASRQQRGLGLGERAARLAHHFWLPAALVAVVLLLLLPRLAGMIDYATSADFPRVQGQTYTYGGGRLNAQDWLSSLPWDVDLLARRRGAKHERLYGFGPLLLLLGCVPWRRVRGLCVAVVLLAAGAFCFTLIAAGVDCVDAVVEDVTFDDSLRALRARVQVPQSGACLLVLSTNFVERLHASGEADAPLITVPAYGVLLGVLVPPGTETVTVRPEPFVPEWSAVGGWLGLLGALALGALVLRRDRVGAAP